ncbi:hypothetical protein J7T55_010927 [Diaporthe amygdali]|uniref:uncharacterized protein n=1 Tax=Phomopsis amygdali TaxID=1214568 RepID=UPI0022FF2018|nr:uncharacterized protein J7T55_010927 [Diaporthe amygdali]KAJ0104461.1 hypothetical protein J7T55_010927 [Diaporthe amygdali]
MMRILGSTAALAGAATAFRNGSTTTESPACPVPYSWIRNDSDPIGACSSDFQVIGDVPDAIHEGAIPPTGIAVDPEHNIFFTYARNMEKQNHTLTKATSFSEEIPWPSEEWQNCAEGQNASTCFVNVQNIVLDSVGGWWVIDSGVPNGAAMPVPDGPKIINFNYTTGEPIRTYIYPEDQWFAKLQLNDIKVNNTLGTGGYAFITEDSQYGSITTLDLSTGEFIRHLYNTTFTRPDERFTSIYNGEPIRNWNGTKPSYMTSGTNGIALTSGNVYWGVKSSHRWYILSQEALISGLSDEELAAKIQIPGNIPSEQAGFTADDKGRIYMMASEHNAILYVDTLESEFTDSVTAVPADGSGIVPVENLVHRTLVRSGLLQAADTACILDGWLYFDTNQQGLAPLRQYNNIDRRRGPFRSYRYWIGRGPAV